MWRNANYLCSGEDLRLGVQANHADVLRVVGFPLRYLRCSSNEPIWSSSRIASSLAVPDTSGNHVPGKYCIKRSPLFSPESITVVLPVPNRVITTSVIHSILIPGRITEARALESD